MQSPTSDTSSTLPVDPLARFVFVLGEVAIGQLAHMERLAVATKKRRLDHEENGGSASVNAAVNQSKKKAAAKKKGKKQIVEEDDESEDEGLDAMMGNTDQEADKELEFYEQVAHKLVSEQGSDSMLSTYSTLIKQVAKCLVSKSDAGKCISRKRESVYMEMHL